MLRETCKVSSLATKGVSCFNESHDVDSFPTSMEHIDPLIRNGLLVLKSCGDIVAQANWVKISFLFGVA